jgi:dephospho-CoA kinase
VASWWEAAGVPVVRADVLARDVVAPGSPGLSAVVEAFGEGVLEPVGAGAALEQGRVAPRVLDREVLRARVLADPGARAQLEGILHPRIQALREAWVADRAREGHRLVVSEIPLLFEAGLEGVVDRIVLVWAPRADCLARLTGERGLPLPQAEALLAAQVPAETVAPRAHHVLRNTGSLDALRCSAGILLDTLQEEARMLSEARACSEDDDA